jgi:hypothetical protein
MANNSSEKEKTLVHRFNLDYHNPLPVALVGCGGNGSQMLYKLARLNFALRELGQPGLHVTVYDPDTVSPANIGRQLFSPDDVGLHKAIVLVNRLNMSYSLSWNAMPQRYSVPKRSSESIAAILITCVDTAAARREIWNDLAASEAVYKPKYWLDLGNTRDAGQVILGQVPYPGDIIAASVPVEDLVAGGARFNGERHLKRWKAEIESKRLLCVTEVFPQLLDKRRKEDDTPSCSLAEALEKQSLFVNDQMSTWAAQLLDGLLREGQLSYHGVFVNLKSGCVTALPVREREIVIKQKRRSTPANAMRRAA